jgi:hypothetical protein
MRLSLRGWAWVTCLSAAGLSSTGPLPAIDCNQNGADDARDIELGTSRDCNKNGTPDECDVLPRNPGFSTPVVFEAKDQPSAIAAGDLDGDGKLDIAAGGRSQVSFLRGDGRGSFAPPQGIPLQGANVQSITAADLDGDRDLDLATANFSSNDVTTLFNNGDGTIALAVNYAVEMQPISLVSADLDGDGAVDLVTANRDSSSLSVLWNRGAGVFGTGERLLVGSFPTSVAAGDLDGDQDTDLVAATSSGPQSVQVLLNRGERTFEQPRGYGESTLTASILVSDLDGDGDLDVAAASLSGSSAVLFLNKGDGTLAPPLSSSIGTRPLRILASDWNGDGNMDLAAINDLGDCESPGGTVSLIINQGAGAFSAPRQMLLDFKDGAGFAASSGGAGDFDADGDPDLVLGKWGNAGLESGLVALLENRLVVTSQDCNLNSIPDECELLYDCNANGLPDACDIGKGGSKDQNSNGLPDECERDCDKSGLPDDLDLARGLSRDDNSNGIPDACETLLADCNSNKVDDREEIASGTSKDCNANEVPDACEVKTVFRFSGKPDFGFDLAFIPGQTAAGDFDGDGDLDLALTRRGLCCPENARGGSVAIYSNPGSGKLTNVGTYRLSADAALLSAVDFDGDRDLDLAVASPANACGREGFLSILLNEGKGTFLSPRNVPAGILDPRSLAAGDLDGDGDQDLALLGVGLFTGSILVFLNDGKGNFAPGSTFQVSENSQDIVAFDSDGDDNLDLAVASFKLESSLFFRNAGHGAFSTPEKLPTGLLRAAGLAAEDLDGDGNIDLAMGGEEGELASPGLGIFWNAGKDHFPQMLAMSLKEGQANLILARDLDGDGDADLAAMGDLSPHITGSGLGALSTLRNEGARSFAAPVRSIIPGFPVHAASADFDGDRDPDLASVSTDGIKGTLSIIKNRAGVFQTSHPYAVGQAPLALAAADFDRNGHVDLATANNGSSDVSLLLNLGAASFAPGARAPVGTGLLAGPLALAAGDLDGDEDADLAVAVSFKIDLLVNQGSGSFQKGQSLPVGSRPVALVAADLDGDHDLDLATANSLMTGFDDNVSVLLNKGAGEFMPARNYAAGKDSRSLAAGDLDRDGDVDLAVLNPGTKDISLLWNQGNAVFAPGAPLPASSDAFLVATTDLQGDGDLDLAAAGSSGLLLFPNQGGGSFGQALELVSLAPHRFLLMPDLDRDGDPDVAAGMNGGLTVSENLGAGKVFDEPAFFDVGFFGALKPAGGADGQGASGDPPFPLVSAMAAVDFDEDGALDLALASSDQSAVTVVLNLTLPARLRDQDRDGVPDECEGDPGFRRGDANQDSRFDISDPVFILRSLFLTGEFLGCEKAGDSNDDGKVDVSDSIRILRHLFLGDDPPPAPFADCGPDPTPDILPCKEFVPCG